MGLEHEIQKTVHQHKGGVESLAELLGRGYSTVCNWANTNHESSPPMHMLLPLMMVTKDYRILRWLAKKTGHVVVRLKKRLPRVGSVTVLGLQKNFNDCSQVLIKRAQGKATKAECRNALYNTIEKLQIAMKALDDEGFLPLEGDPQLCLDLLKNKTS